MSEQPMDTVTIARTNGHRNAAPATPEATHQTAMARWDPVELFGAIQDEMDRFWRRLGPQLPATPRLRFPGNAAARTTWAPRIDVFEKDRALIIRADLPGLKKEDVHVDLGDGVLVIRGETQHESDSRADQYYRVERSSGSFYRRLPLPFEVDSDHIKAGMSDGVLEIRIERPSGEHPAAHSIPIV
jgi:HSP20 family protein